MGENLHQVQSVASVSKIMTAVVALEHGLLGEELEAGAEILVSLENKMACGIGACLGCTCHSRKKGAISVCKQGPVLKGEDVYG